MANTPCWRLCGFRVTLSRATVHLKGVIKRRFVIYPLLTAAYAISGKLGLLLAVPPGYASPIFPPAGIAVAAVLIAGRFTCLGFFLAPFLNVWTGSSIERLLT